MKLATLLITALTIGAIQAGTETSTANVKALTSAASVQAAISGVEEHAVYTELPPVLVELDGLATGAEVWVEAHRGNADKPANTKKVKAQTFALKSGKRVINLSGLHKTCAADGTWTVRVMAGAGLSAKSVANVTFELDRDSLPRRERRLVANGVPSMPAL